ncbi:hypothetical protein AB0C51_25210, partial [Streptomyces pathocidini]
MSAAAVSAAAALDRRTLLAAAGAVGVSAGLGLAFGPGGSPLGPALRTVEDLRPWSCTVDEVARAFAPARPM